MTTRFEAVLLLNGKTATGIEVPPGVMEALGSGRRPAVQVTLGSYAYRTTIGSMGGRSMIPVSAEHREAAGIAAGDRVDVTLALDTAPREVALPADLADALAVSPEAARRFDTLSYSHKRAHVLAVEGAKKPETRQRRIEKTIAALLQDR